MCILSCVIHMTHIVVYKLQVFVWFCSRVGFILGIYVHIGYRAQRGGYTIDVYRTMPCNTHTHTIQYACTRMYDHLWCLQESVFVV